jgi:hypothetical protein
VPGVRATEQTTEGENDMSNEPNLDKTMNEINERLKFQAEHIKICARMFSSLIANMHEVGVSDEAMVSALIEVLYLGEVLDNNISEPMIEEARRRRNEALGGTYEETAFL